ncbi:zeta toxin family protein [Mucilaginibacter sp. X4EP1]|uniref:zeta toxin family protein n=1 Tax=Mucilaginibacter sp. X4EP1 TaxID=2723092 RepID=UPI002169BB58|nr:zeta toxin family protein [Mucilaginibacter sp. X4EP1]MCS3814428.1 putative ABC-type ATPase [Mucilaginibacter sp. X4EP1]
MHKPQLIFVAGCNAAGKSTFIRTRLVELDGFEVLMTDVYKGRTKELARKAFKSRKNVVIETVFNDDSFKELADEARNSGYQTSLVVLFLDSLQQSIDRVAFRGTQQSGITISGSNVKINFNESFKNVATYFFYFDRSDFIYTGVGEVNQIIMSFEKSKLISYHANNLNYPQKFAVYSFQQNRLNEDAYNIIVANESFPNKLQ